jgi:hypothetical protein
LTVTFAGIQIADDSESEKVSGFAPGPARKLLQSENLIAALRQFHIDRTTVSQDLPITVVEVTSSWPAAANRSFQRRGEIPATGTLVITHEEGGFLHTWTFTNAACPAITPDLEAVSVKFTYNFIVGTPGYSTSDPEAVPDDVIDGGDDWDVVHDEWVDGGNFADNMSNARVVDAGTWD